MNQLTPKRIKQIRLFYGFSTVSMSRLCGFGVNQWRNYENGDLPNNSNYTLIQMVGNPLILWMYAKEKEFHPQFTKEHWNRLRVKIKQKANQVQEIIDADAKPISELIYH